MPDMLIFRPWLNCNRSMMRMTNADEVTKCRVAPLAHCGRDAMSVW
jgi:hypothetical protein